MENEEGKGENDQVLNSEEGSFNNERPIRKDRGYYIQKHQRPDGGIAHEEIIEPKSVTLYTRKTQTPVRDVSNEGVQYNVEDTKHPKIQNRNILKQRATPDVQMDSEERLPFSTIRK